MHYRFMAILLGFLVAAAPANAADGDMEKIAVTDSLKDTEILLARILKDKLNINGTLSIRGDNSEDMLLQVRFDANDEQNIPAINAIIDSRIVSRDSSGKANSQIVSIASFANLSLVPDKAIERLEWVNKWNRRTNPVNLYVAGDRIVAKRSMLVTAEEPLTSGQFIVNFSATIRSWPALIKDLRDSSLAE